MAAWDYNIGIMFELPKDISMRFKEARRNRGLGQTELARAVGCKQSAISMFESGRITAISEETIGKIAAELGIDLKAMCEKAPDKGVAASISVLKSPRLFCPDMECPSNYPYLVGGRLMVIPLKDVLPHGGGKFCPYCGEVLERNCPECGAPLNDGACCSQCSFQYIQCSLSPEVDLQRWVEARRIEIESFFNGFRRSFAKE